MGETIKPDMIRKMLQKTKQGHRIKQMLNFIRESNQIENIYRDPSEAEIAEYCRFMMLKKPTIKDLESFVLVYQPGIMLRDRKGDNVVIFGGGKVIHEPPKGGPYIRSSLETILDNLEEDGPFLTHIKYESLHPFMDGNGRSGRMLWRWHMEKKAMKLSPLGFKQTWYYQSLQAYQRGMHNA